MLLTYRGITYNRPDNQVKTAPGKVMGFYRGAAWSEQNLVSERPSPAAQQLTWRGVTYKTDGSAVVRDVEAPVVAPVAKAQPQGANLGNTHRDWILKSLEHRLSVARNQGNQRLVEMLEDEWKQFA